MLLDGLCRLGLCTLQASTCGHESRPFLPTIAIHVNTVPCTHTGVQYYSADDHLIQSETCQHHIPVGGTKVHRENFALRGVSSRLVDAQSLQVVVMLLLDGPADLDANASEDVRLGLVDILCKQHQRFIVSDQSCLQITTVDVSQNGYG